MKKKTFHDRLARRVLVPTLSQLGQVSTDVEVGPPRPMDRNLGFARGPVRREAASGCRSSRRRSRQNGASQAAARQASQGTLRQQHYEAYAREQALKQQVQEEETAGATRAAIGLPVMSGTSTRPRLWMLCPDRPDELLSEEGGFVPLTGWPKGTYERAQDNAGLVVLNELPDQPDTLLLRLIATGEVRRVAIQQLVSLPPDAFEHAVYIELAKFHGEVMHQPSRNADEEEFLEHSRELFQKYLREVEEKARSQGAATLMAGQLEHKFGKLPAWRRIQLEQGSAEQMTTWAERLLAAPTLDAVFDAAVGGEPK